MWRKLVLLLFLGVGLAAVKERVIDSKLSDKEFGTADYDHEAFLGKETAQELDDLAPEESKRRLAIIVKKVDKNEDGSVTEQELEDWVRLTHNKYISEDSDKRFRQLVEENQGEPLHWNNYKKMVYGYGENGELVHEVDETEDYRKMYEREEKRWKRADSDEDGVLTLEEFRGFSHPEEYPHLHDIVVSETMEELDKDNDGGIDLKEYVSDVYHPNNEEPEPDWVQNEREQFEARDVNKNGKMDADEVKEWILPTDYDHAKSEARHLVHEADDDKDGELSTEEILLHHATFVGSQVTNYGEALKHDEF
uniref:Reticulocalbin-3 n=1 Tax=Ciona intestinalis TaxID=7719 RepID=F7AV16_CIOIN